MTRDEANAALDRGKEIMVRAGWKFDGERRSHGFWFVCGKRGDRLHLTLEYSGRWDAMIMIGAHEIVHRWSEAADPDALLNEVASEAKAVLASLIDALS